MLTAAPSSYASDGLRGLAHIAEACSPFRLVQVVTCIRLVDELVRAEDPNYKITPKSEVTSKFYVLPEMIGPAIIGKAGTHAKHIRERTGVRIEVIREYKHGHEWSAELCCLAA